MKFKVNREKLEKKLSKASMISNYKDYKGVVQINILKDGLLVFGTDGVHSVQEKIGVSFDDAQESSIFVDARKVINFLKNLATFEVENVEIELSEKHIAIQAPKASCSFPILEVSTYPSIPSTNMEKGFMIEVDSTVFLRKLINASRTVKAEDGDILSYINIRAGNGLLEMLSTDGVRLCKLSNIECSLLDIEKQEKSSELIEFNFSAKVVKLMDAYAGTNTTVVISKEYVYVISGESIITYKRGIQDYPDIRRAISDVDFSSGSIPFTTVWRVKGKEINAAVSLIKNIMIDDEDKVIKLTSGKLVTTKSKDRGEFKVDGTVEGDEEFEIAFDIRKLDVLNNGIEDLKICIIDKKQPIYIYDAREQNNFTSTFVVMPVIA